MKTPILTLVILLAFYATSYAAEMRTALVEIITPNAKCTMTLEEQPKAKITRKVKVEPKVIHGGFMFDSAP